MCKPPPKVIFRWEQREGNRNIRRNASASVISPLLTLLSAHAESAVVLKVLSLTKVEVPNFSLLLFSILLCLIHGQVSVTLQSMKRSVICECQCFFVSSIIKNGKLYLKYHLLCHSNFLFEQIQLSLYSQFSLTKILEVLQLFIFVRFWSNVLRPS